MKRVSPAIYNDNRNFMKSSGTEKVDAKSLIELVWGSKGERKVDGMSKKAANVLACRSNFIVQSGEIVNSFTA